MKFLLLPVLFVLVACESRTLNTSQPFSVDILGTDEAYCILSTPHYRYALNAPGDLKIERTEDDMKVDCRDNAIQRRRTVTVKPEWDTLYYRYPEKVTVDFSSLDNGKRMNGYRVPSVEKVQMEKQQKTTIKETQFSQTLNDVLTEDSYSQPVSLKPDPAVEKVKNTGIRSYPVQLTDDKNVTSSGPLTPTMSSDLNPSAQ